MYKGILCNFKYRWLSLTELPEIIANIWPK